MEPAELPATTVAQRRRLRQLWRSAGWPCHDSVEVELLAAGLVMQSWDPQGRLLLRLSETGLQVLAASLRHNRHALDSHEALVARVAEQMQRAGRLAWRGLTLRAALDPDADRAWTGEPGAGTDPPAIETEAVPATSAAPAGLALATSASIGLDLPTPDGPLRAAVPRRRWVYAMPDVYSIRQTSVEDYLEPAVHEIKVSRADLLSDLRKPAKGQAYRALSSQCWYVLQAGIAEVDEVPADFGVIVAHEDRLELLRPAPRRPMRMHFDLWMALVRATPLPAVDDERQAPLGAVDAGAPHLDGEAAEAGDPPGDPPTASGA